MEPRAQETAFVFVDPAKFFTRLYRENSTSDKTIYAPAGCGSTWLVYSVHIFFFSRLGSSATQGRVVIGFRAVTTAIKTVYMADIDRQGRVSRND